MQSVLIVVAAFVYILALTAILYKPYFNCVSSNIHSVATLEERLGNAIVVKRMKEYVNANPYQKASQADFTELRHLINEEIPHFYTTLNTTHYTLSEIEYDVSILLRVHFSPMDIHKLTGMSPSYVSNMRSRLLLRVYRVNGSPADYDKRVLAIS